MWCSDVGGNGNFAVGIVTRGLTHYAELDMDIGIDNFIAANEW